MTIHNVKPHEKFFLKVWLNNSVVSLADEYIVHSEDNKNLFMREGNITKPIHIIPHGIIEIQKSNKLINELKEKYKFDKKDIFLLFFGNIRDYKGLDILLNSLSKLNNKNIKLIIAGKPWKNFKRYEGLIEKLNLKERVKLFLDFNSNKKVAELFKLSDLVVYPYKEFEASSGAGAVALNFEKPMVVTDVGGLPDIVKDKNVIAKPNNPIDLKEKMIYALKNLNKLTKDSKEKAREFSWKKIAGMTVGVYER